jgi:ATP-binding cassette subfamily B multidrug efflux pump
MKLIARYLGKYRKLVALSIFIKLLGTVAELMLPYILEHIIDHVVPIDNLAQVLGWGLMMFAAAVICRQLNVLANRQAIENAHNISYDVRQALFVKTMNLSGGSFDLFGLPSIISRMTSDSYNVQSAVQQFQTLCVRAPMTLVGGVIVSMVMDFQLSLILLVMLPFLLLVILLVSAKGIPMYSKVQQRLDTLIRIMREDIAGIRVVKALSKTEYEKRRFAQANQTLADSDITAATLMALPGPFMQVCVNAGLALVVFFGAQRVNAGQIEPGVILAFLTYFNMIAMGVMGVSRIFMTMSRASASANRIDAILHTETNQPVLNETQAQKPTGGGFIRFEGVSFCYGGDKADGAGEEQREKALSDISFTIKKGESLGIIGPTGCGKSTIINLLMRFYDVDSGGIFLDGRDVRTYDRDDLRKRFGTVFQNDLVFHDTLRENIDFGRGLSDCAIRGAAKNAMAAEFIDEFPFGFGHEACIKGANLSGGQKQRLLIARALAASPEILVLDDSSSALDYKTDANMRGAIEQNYPDTTLILIAQRVSSVMGMDKILVMDNGKCVGYGNHEELLRDCPAYRETYEIQMGALT